MDKRQIGMQYREDALRALARLGYATIRQLAKLLHGRCTESTLKMTGRTLRWLRDNGFVVTRRDTTSVTSELLVAVNGAGARWLAAEGRPLPDDKIHARDWLRHAHRHRTVCNSVFTALRIQSPDSKLWSELEVRAGEAQLDFVNYRFDGQWVAKVPDLVVATSGGLEWVEVENSWRSDKDVAKMVESMRAMFAQPGGLIARVHFVIAAPGAKTIGTRMRRKLTHGNDFATPRQVRELDARILEEHIIVSKLDHEQLELVPVTL
ncbi:hypothetical protein AB4Y38_12370 [Paraburkholderia sp. EG285A]|uniref:hypothetical protein n=1 Tax=Paraburkholderia sp. EG285A TaxID=3237009 RepID=UPI0034D2C6A3